MVERGEEIRQTPNARYVDKKTEKDSSIKKE